MSNDVNKPTHAVLYTDGGCDNPQIAGWGVHGYFYTEEPAKQGTGNPKALPTTKGYKMGASGKPDITLTHYIDAFGSVVSNATNNLAEAMASFNALKIVKAQGLKHAILIKDSQYAQNGFDKWMYDWQKNNWTRKDGLPVSNLELWKEIYALKSELVANGVTFSTQWVKGHSGELGNDRADNLASAGKACARNQNPRESFLIRDAKGFWNPRSERSRLFSLPNWYFAAYEKPENEGREVYRGRNLYYIGTIRDDIELIGKAIADASFAILLLKDADPCLEVIREGTKDMYNGRPQGVMVAYLDQIFKPALYDELLDFGRDGLLKDKRAKHLMTRDKKLVLHETDPPGLSFRLMDHLGLLEDCLRDYLKAKEAAASGIAVKNHYGTNDITDLLYEKTEAKGKVTVKLKNSITSATRSLKVPAKYRDDAKAEQVINVVLTLAQDLPDRNTLAAIAGPDITVTLLTWPESTRAIRFAVIIESNGDVGIWAGPYSNLQMLPLK